MSSYFDDADADVNGGDLSNALNVERRIVADVLDVSSDWEFPADARGWIETWIKDQALANDPRMFEVVGSRLIGSLHSVFHDVAARRIETRFGLLTDHPAYMLVARRRLHTKDWM